jgi:hypothetical protein
MSKEREDVQLTLACPAYWWGRGELVTSSSSNCERSKKISPFRVIRCFYDVTKTTEKPRRDRQGKQKGECYEQDKSIQKPDVNERV